MSRIAGLLSLIRLSSALTGKWHLPALCACLSAWFASSNALVPVCLVLVYLTYLAAARQYPLFLILVTVFLAVAADDHFFIQNTSGLSPQTTVITGKITDIPVFDGDRLRFTLRTESGERIQVLVRLRKAADKNRLMKALKPGLFSRLEGKLVQPPEPTNFHAFDYRDYLKKQQIFWQFQAEGIQDYADADPDLLDRLNRMRMDQLNRIDRTFTPQSAGMIKALVFGDDQAMDPDLIDAYRLFGLVHLLVVSGMHITVIFGFLYFVLRRAGVVKEYALFSLLLLIPVYVLLTGAQPSAVRSGLTAALMFIGAIIGRNRLSMTDMLSFSCLIMVFAHPPTVYDLGFQLSFAVTFAVILAAPEVMRRHKSPVMRLLMLSMICEMAAFPIAVYHFYQLSVVGFFLSIFFVPFLTLMIMPLAFAAYLTSLFFPSAPLLMSPVLDLLLRFPHQMLRALFRHPFLQLNYGAMAEWMLAAAIIILALALIVWETVDRHWTVFLPLLAFLSIYGLVFLSDLIDPYGSVTFLDVGQGDSILIRLPHRQGSVLIDSGGTLPFPRQAWQTPKRSFDVGRDVVLHELRAARIDQLDAVVMTHKDYDHVGGMKQVLAGVSVKKLVVSAYFDPDPDDLKLFREAVQNGARMTVLGAGQTLPVGSADFDILSPIGRAEDTNGNSIVIRTFLGGSHWLFTGDLPVTGEQKILSRRIPVQADVLKLGHHGSRTSTSARWLEAVKPSVAIVSAGKNNRYGHPHEEIIQRLKKYRVQTIRTDQSGAIRFLFTDHRIDRIETAVRE
ncbi:DNA internalization-related competence protein ComEC/Rec2 [Sporolactobacillus vineae]|uniref:DNA internalization-related competence protein ComEC/Rec2 n=1 Tax=Sporolactobacillus vineae TaxID=444463 RepID=UPI0002898798|nr:DNA internalization-related competence protein ComEC/Rec2 [Sporolactobacillus vineae]